MGNSSATGALSFPNSKIATLTSSTPNSCSRQSAICFPIQPTSRLTNFSHSFLVLPRIMVIVEMQNAFYYPISIVILLPVINRALGRKTIGRVSYQKESIKVMQLNQDFSNVDDMRCYNCDMGNHGYKATRKASLFLQSGAEKMNFWDSAEKCPPPPSFGEWGLWVCQKKQKSMEWPFYNAIQMCPELIFKKNK